MDEGRDLLYHTGLTGDGCRPRPVTLCIRRHGMTQTAQAQPPMGDEWVRVATLAALQAEGRLTVLAKQHVVALFEHNGQVYAVDNRCPHMGFPLDKGTVN